jgi:hypothetical protein
LIQIDKAANNSITVCAGANMDWPGHRARPAVF